MHDMENEPLDNRVPIIERHKEIDLIQSCINRMAQNSFQVKGWTVALFAVVLALLPEKVEDTNKFLLGIVMLAISIMFWYLDSFFLAAERNYRKIYGWVLQEREKGSRELLYELNFKEFESKESLKGTAISSRWISSGERTCISLALAEGRRQKSDGFLGMIFSETALSSAAWKVVWMPRTVWPESPSPYCSCRSRRPFCLSPV